MRFLIQKYEQAVDASDHYVVPLVLLLIRGWVSWVFFRSGLIKFNSWDSTLYLFEYEYQVPLLPWLWAAYLGTAAELILPVLLVLGLFTRPTAFALFVFNIIAVVSYPTLWAGGFNDHQLWGMMLMVCVLWGAGPISVDRWLAKKWG
ncbi:DoxX family protein [Motilimonas eburnea]|uniref:DoxX family protein n=1 Tax=Motilimonas eburnea TaxID=1737488 RepID=UPI001E52824B|nr:DoxX family protein [Motilimonas eburnea]MCE2573006.1 DoxX family protein [Motilimonas eburnea]